MCHRYYCYFCLKGSYDTLAENIKDNNAWLCPFCTGACYCTRCMRNEKILQLIAYYFSINGDINYLHDQLINMNSIIDELFTNTVMNNVYLILYDKNLTPAQMVNNFINYDPSKFEDILNKEDEIKNLKEKNLNQLKNINEFKNEMEKIKNQYEDSNKNQINENTNLKEKIRLLEEKLNNKNSEINNLKNEYENNRKLSEKEILKLKTENKNLKLSTTNFKSKKVDPSKLKIVEYENKINLLMKENEEYKNNLNNINLITKNNPTINQNMNNQNISNDENLIEIPKYNKPDFLDSRREYLYNKSHNTASIGNIITDPYSKKSINQISEYKKKIQKERDYKELLDEQIIYTNNNYRSLKRSYTNPNPYQAIREKKSPFYELPEDPYNLKIYNYNVISSLKNNPITNPVNSYLFKDKRKAYNGYFKNLGLNIIKK